MKIESYITVDFEDFSHDYHRAIGSTGQLRSREHALYKSYDFIANALATHGQTSVATFFCTGILAQNYPKLIQKIHNDGNEIACHNYYHDDVNKENPREFEDKVILAIDTLNEITGDNVKGFRAPRFSLTMSDKKHLKIINRYFKYDSSLHFNTLDELQLWSKNSDLVEFPVGVTKKMYPGVGFKPGGSYFKLGTSSAFKGIIYNLHRHHITPIIYLHPYDLLSDRSFALSWREIDGMSIMKRAYWYCRQSQWTQIGNYQVEQKLNNILKFINHQGRLDQLLSKERPKADAN